MSSGCSGGATGSRRRTGARGCASRLQELHVVGDDFSDAALLSVLAFPRAGLDAALDENQRAFARVLRDRLGQVSLADRVGDDVVIVGELLAFAVGTGRPTV